MNLPRQKLKCFSSKTREGVLKKPKNAAKHFRQFLSFVQLCKHFTPALCLWDRYDWMTGGSTMAKNGGSTESHLARAPCVPVALLVLIGLEAKGLRCAVEPSPGRSVFILNDFHMRC